MRYEITATSSLRAGTVAALGNGDVVTVRPSAKDRPDWAAIARAVATAFVRGAEVRMYGGDEV